jgi:hypothetical protein
MIPLQTIEQISSIKKGDYLTLHNERPSERYRDIFNLIGFTDTTFAVIKISKPTVETPSSFEFLLRLSHPEAKTVNPLRSNS